MTDHRQEPYIFACNSGVSGRVQIICTLGHAQWSVDLLPEQAEKLAAELTLNASHLPRAMSEADIGLGVPMPPKLELVI